MEIEYDLATLAENLADEFPEITELYLFGSRARGTKSTRSDVDVLVISEAYIKPQLLREFSFDNCAALDLFWVDGGRAISSQNESFIQAEDLPSLLKLLGAVKIWSRSEGRAQANIDWRFEIREDVQFIPTALPNQTILQNDTLVPVDPSNLTLKEIFSLLTNLKPGQAWKLGGIVLGLIGLVFWLGTQWVKLGHPTN